MVRVGFGYDTHAFVEGRPLMLGGVHIPYEKGLKGHSDADVLTHALIDALLGALALGDIGAHFPDTDGQYKNIDSMILLEKTMKIIQEEQYQVNNIDSTLILELPKMRPYIDEIRKSLASALSLNMSEVSVKATTNEKMGFLGRQEGIVAMCVVSLTKLQ